MDSIATGIAEMVHVLGALRARMCHCRMALFGWSKPVSCLYNFSQGLAESGHHAVGWRCRKRRSSICRSAGSAMGPMIRRLLVALGLLLMVQDAASAASLLVRWLDGSGAVLVERNLSLAALDDSPQSEIVTVTPWTVGEQHFAGPSLEVLASLASLKPDSVHVLALNDYSADIPAADWRQGIILATRLNGETMRVRDKGPFWVMYPISSNPEFARQIYQARMVWQVKQLDFFVK